MLLLRDQDGSSIVVLFYKELTALAGGLLQARCFGRLKRSDGNQTGKDGVMTIDMSHGSVQIRAH